MRQECGLTGDVAVGGQEQQRRVKHEKGEDELEKYNTCAKNTFLTRLEPCVHVTRMRSVRSTQ